MKKAITLCASMAVGLSMFGVAPQALPVQVGSCQSTIREASVKAVSPAHNKRTIKAIQQQPGSAVRTPLQRTLPSVPRPVRASRAALPEGFCMYESFEGWDGELLSWLPDGWTLDSRSGRPAGDYSTWTPSAAIPVYGLVPADGETMMGVSYDDETAQDERLVSPQFVVGDGCELKFYAYISPIFLFNLDNFDWDTNKFVGDRQVQCTMKVLVREEGGDWVVLWDAVDDWMDVSESQLMYSSPTGLEEYVVSMASYAGKTVQIAFQYVGIDGDTMFLDMASVGLPALEGVVYDNPMEVLYWGVDDSWSFCSNVAQYPAGAPLTWYNFCEMPTASFSWHYQDPATMEWAVTDGVEELAVEYLSDKFTTDSEGGGHATWFDAPVLSASAPGLLQTSYQDAYQFQAGGLPVYTEDGTDYVYPLVPFSVEQHAFGIVTKDAEFGSPSTPIFGYDSNADAWWLNYTYNGDMEDAAESDHVFVEAIMNRLIVGSGPMVINGVSVLGKGKIGADAEFKIEIIVLDDDGVPMVDTPTAVAVCKGSEVAVTEGGMQDYLNVGFTFETPVVITPGDNDYMVRFSGFHDPENVQYFAPIQSLLPFSHMNVIGWLDKQIKIQGASEYRRTYNPTFYYESEYGMCHTAFAIQYAAYHPWLTAEVDEVVVGASPVEIPLNSYYEGSELTVEAPAGVSATVTGRYGDCKLVVSHSDTDVIAEGELTISAPGVQKVFAVSEHSGIEGVVGDAEAKTPVAAYSITGQAVELGQVKSGVYVVKYSDGTASKVCVR